ncbi:MAG: Rieske 2Fe-2S domain-containing protein [Deltaproteobacteria bacterium]|nr:Rieske 2Fe-2S domain-containing protein [Deltaproteobacteria bacterium]
MPRPPIPADALCHRANPWQQLYDSARKILRTAWNAAGEASNVVRQYVDWFTPGEARSVSAIAPGEGAVIRHGLRKIAVYRDEHGIAHACSAVCPHLKGIVTWNAAEKSWDCPVHGSRFDPMGKVIHGPAACDLAVAGVAGAPFHRPAGPHRRVIGG